MVLLSPTVISIKWMENLSWSGCDWLDHIDLFNPHSLIFQYHPRPLSDDDDYSNNSYYFYQYCIC